MLICLYLFIYFPNSEGGSLALFQSPGLRPKGDVVCQEEEGNWLGWQLVSTDTAGVRIKSQRQVQSCIAISTPGDCQAGPTGQEQGRKTPSWNHITLRVSSPNSRDIKMVISYSFFVMPRFVTNCTTWVLSTSPTWRPSQRTQTQLLNLSPPPSTHIF